MFNKEIDLPVEGNILDLKKQFIINSNPKKIEIFDFHNTEIHDQTSLEYLFKNDFMINFDDLYCHVYVSNQIDYNRVFTSFYDNTYKGTWVTKDLSNRSSFLSSYTPLKEQVLHNLSSQILKSIDKGNVKSMGDLRETLKLYFSKDMIDFQNKKIIYSNILEHIENKIRFINEIESNWINLFKMLLRQKLKRKFQEK